MCKDLTAIAESRQNLGVTKLTKLFWSNEETYRLMAKRKQVVTKHISFSVLGEEYGCIKDKISENV
jgi:hypothetical protein